MNGEQLRVWAALVDKIIATYPAPTVTPQARALYEQEYESECEEGMHDVYTLDEYIDQRMKYAISQHQDASDRLNTLAEALAQGLWVGWPTDHVKELFSLVPHPTRANCWWLPDDTRPEGIQ